MFDITQFIYNRKILTRNFQDALNQFYDFEPHSSPIPLKRQCLCPIIFTKSVWNVSKDTKNHPFRKWGNGKWGEKFLNPTFLPLDTL